jgi:HD superfamily phosphohydrolase
MEDPRKQRRERIVNELQERIIKIDKQIEQLQFDKDFTHPFFQNNIITKQDKTAQMKTKNYLLNLLSRQGSKTVKCGKERKERNKDKSKRKRRSFLQSNSLVFG